MRVGRMGMGMAAWFLGLLLVHVTVGSRERNAKILMPEKMRTLRDISLIVARLTCF